MNSMSQRAGPRRVGLPRAKSTSNMAESGFSREALRDMARDAVVERDNLRALADFFRTTLPPSETRNSLSADECTVFCGADGRKLLWSGQSLRGRAKRSKSQQFQQFQPASSHLPSGVTLETTTDGNPYALISLPISIEGSGPWFQAPETIFRAPTQITTAATSSAGGHNGNGWWPERISSRGTLSGPTTPLPAIPAQRSSLEAKAARKTPNNTSKSERDQQPTIHEACAPEIITFASKLGGLEPASWGSAFVSEASEQHSAAAQTAQALVLGSEVSGLDSSLTCPGSMPPTPHFHGIKECGNSDGSSSSRSPTRQWPMPSPTSPLPPTPSLQHRRQMSKAHTSSPSGAGSPALGSPCKSPRTLTNIAVQSGLQVPATNILPDSPGFAKMLASTTFPSPPSSSRPSTARSNSTGTITRTPSPPASPPTIRPRTSSKSSAASTNGRHATSNKQLSSSSSSFVVSAVLLPPASLNEIVMRPDCHNGQNAPAHNPTAQPEQRHVDQGSPQMPPTTNQTNSLISSAAALLARRESMDSTSILVDAVGRPESAASFATARERPDSVYSIYDVAAAGDTQRISKASDLTITTDSYQQSLATSRASQQSARSDTTTTTIDSVNAYDDDGRHITSSRTSLDIDDLSDEARFSPAKVPLSIQQNSVQGAAAPEGSSPVRHAAEEVPRPESRNAVEEFNVQQSLLERRMARRTARKVWALETLHAGDQGGLAQAPAGEQAFRRRISQSVDSPILGWFPGGNGSGGGGVGGALRSHLRSSVSGPSPLANETLTSLPGSPVESAEKRCSIYVSPPAPSTQEEAVPAFSAYAQPSRPLRHQLSISSTMVMETTPDDIPESPTPTDPVSPVHLTISPIFVVASLEPGTGAVTPSPSRLRPLSLMFMDKANLDLNHRSPLSKVKAKPRQRPLSVRIARNSITGLLERTESPAVPADQTMLRNPTPPETPEPFLNRRLSAMRPLPVRLPTPEPTQVSKHSDNDDSSSSEEEERPDPTQRIANIKERLRKEKLQKEQEIASMIARTVVTIPRTQEEYDTSHEDEASPEDEDEPSFVSCEEENVGMSRDVTTPTSMPMPSTPELEERIEKLSQSGDRWTGVMGPLMKNMSRMLLEMQGDGMCVGLTMREFNVDLEAEAKRISTYGQAASMPVEATPNADAHMNTNVNADTGVDTNVDRTFDGFDGVQPAAATIPQVPVANDMKPRKGRSATSLARLRLDLDGSVMKPQETQDAENTEEDAVSGVQKSSASEITVPSTPRSPAEKLEMDALMSITRRMQAQEALMDTLMNRWGTPTSSYKARNESSLSDYDSARPSMASDRPSNDGSSASGMGAALEDLKQRAYPQASKEDINAGSAPTQHHGANLSTGKQHTRNKQSGMDVVDSLMGELRCTSTMSNRS